MNQPWFWHWRSTVAVFLLSLAFSPRARADNIGVNFVGGDIFNGTPMAAGEPRMAKTIMVVASVRIGLTGAPTTTTKAHCRV